MSTSSSSGDSGTVAAVIIVVLIVLGIKFAIIYWCCVRVRQTIRSDVQQAVAYTQPRPLIQPHSYAVQVWEVDAPTMERFLNELAKEKPVRFTAQQLCAFTNNYSKSLGSGGFGVVYKGQFPNGVSIAVKVLNRSLERTAEEQFMAEVATIGRTYHINLVRLYGFCYDPLLSALVYEYMENGSLASYLFGGTQDITDFDKLHQIAVGTAKGIAYLHEECMHRIIHYDIKPGNVLLDENFVPKVGDFGLAKLCSRDITHVSITGYRGTPGYSAPEFLTKNFPITYKCDVYSFGMLLFEMVGRRKNTNVGSGSSLDWFPKEVWNKYDKGELEALTTSCGIEEKDKEKAKGMAMIALWCVQDRPDDRPPMSLVVRMLEGGLDITAPPKPFNYLISSAAGAPLELNDVSSYTTSESTNYQWGRDTPIMTKYDIQMASK